MKLRVLARGLALAADLDAMEAGVRRFIGRKLDRSLGHEFKDEHGNVLRTGGFPRVEEPVEVSDRAEHVQYVREGDLWPADAATAKRCGVPFDPTFGGEVADEHDGGDAEKA